MAILLARNHDPEQRPLITQIPSSSDASEAPTVPHFHPFNFASPRRLRRSSRFNPFIVQSIFLCGLVYEFSPTADLNLTVSEILLWLAILTKTYFKSLEKLSDEDNVDNLIEENLAQVGGEDDNGDIGVFVDDMEIPNFELDNEVDRREREVVMHHDDDVVEDHVEHNAFDDNDLNDLLA
ncbi:hypothetical protein K1719_034871 [Acacia pycnantha]|nr:hypothetical protein K1719_034871 [Acacia pycnantha]